MIQVKKWLRKIKIEPTQEKEKFLFQLPVAALRKSLKERDLLIKSVAIELLGKMKSKESVKDLIELLNDEIGYIRQNTALALGNIGDRRAVPTLIKLLEDLEEVRMS